MDGKEALLKAIEACRTIRDMGGGRVPSYEDNHADGFLDACNECEWAIAELLEELQKPLDDSPAV